MAEHYGWERAYEKKGLAVFDELTVETFRRVQKKYSSDYVPFLDKMSAAVGKNMVRPVSQLKQVIQGLVQDIGLLLSGKLTADGSAGLAGRIREGQTQVDKGMRFVREHLQRSYKLRKAVEQAEADTGVTFEELRSSQELIGSRMGEIQPKRAGFLATVEKAVPSAYGVGKDLAGGLTSAMLGPFGGMARVVGESGLSLYKYVRDQQVKKREARFATGLTPMAKDYGATGPLESLYGKMGTGEDLLGFLFGSDLGKNKNKDLLGALQALIGKQGPGPTKGGPGQAQPGPVMSTVSSSLGGPLGWNLSTTGQESVHVRGDKSEIFNFFDKFAFKAKWTKAVWELLGGQKKGPAGEGGMLEGMLAGKALGGLARLGRSVGSAVGGALLTAFGVGGAGAALAGSIVAFNKAVDKLEKVSPKLGTVADAIIQMSPLLNAGRHPLDRLGALTHRGGFGQEFSKEQADMTKTFRDMNKILLDGVKQWVQNLLTFNWSSVSSLLGSKMKGMTAMPTVEALKQVSEGAADYLFGGSKFQPGRGQIQAVTAGPAGAVQGKTVDINGQPVGGKTAFQPKDAQTGAADRLVAALEKLASRLDRQGTGIAGGPAGPSPIGSTRTDDPWDIRDSFLGALNGGSLGLVD